MPTSLEGPLTRRPAPALPEDTARTEPLPVPTSARLPPRLPSSASRPGRRPPRRPPRRPLRPRPRAAAHSCSVLPPSGKSLAARPRAPPPSRSAARRPREPSALGAPLPPVLSPLPCPAHSRPEPGPSPVTPRRQQGASALDPRLGCPGPGCGVCVRTPPRLGHHLLELLTQVPRRHREVSAAGVPCPLPRHGLLHTLPGAPVGGPRCLRLGALSLPTPGRTHVLPAPLSGTPRCEHLSPLLLTVVAVQSAARHDGWACEGRGDAGGRALTSAPLPVPQHSPFFAEQLTAFQVWLTMGVENRSPPEQLPIVLQVSPSSALPAGRTLPLLGQTRGRPCDSAVSDRSRAWPGAPGARGGRRAGSPGLSRCSRRRSPAPRTLTGVGPGAPPLPHALGGPMEREPSSGSASAPLMSEAHGAQTTQGKGKGACADGTGPGAIAAAPGHVPTPPLRRAVTGRHAGPVSASTLQPPACGPGVRWHLAHQHVWMMVGAGGGLGRAERLPPPLFQGARVPAEVRALGHDGES